MDDWLKIQCEKRRDLRWNAFIQANPTLDWTMKMLLANFLHLDELSVHRWIMNYQQLVDLEYAKCECLLFHCVKVLASNAQRNYLHYR